VNLFLDANICLDLLDTTRPTSKASIAWYLAYKDDSRIDFYFSGDFITTFYYILSERRKIAKRQVVEAIEALSMEVTPLYLSHHHFIEAKNSFYDEVLDDFEDLMILHSALASKMDAFITNDEALLQLQTFGQLTIKSPQ
jgi:predicted nucleic acid-binding protein